MTCAMPIEKGYYSKEPTFPSVCCYCGADSGIVNQDDSNEYPICKDCCNNGEKRMSRKATSKIKNGKRKRGNAYTEGVGTFRDEDAGSTQVLLPQPASGSTIVAEASSASTNNHESSAIPEQVPGPTTNPTL